MNKPRRAAEVGLVMGIVLIVMGIAYTNSGLWILGAILLAIGGVTRHEMTKMPPKES